MIKLLFYSRWYYYKKNPKSKKWFTDRINKIDNIDKTSLGFIPVPQFVIQNNEGKTNIMVDDSGSLSIWQWFWFRNKCDRNVCWKR